MHCEGGSSTKVREGISGQSSREENETNKDGPRGRTDGFANDSYESEVLLQRGTRIKFKQQWRRSKKRQFPRRQ